MNPETRARLNTISRTLESANETAQENIYTFTQIYIDPCLGGLKSCVYDYTAPCFPSREDNLRRKHGRSRGRDDVNFDFYDDWLEEEEANGFAGWGHDELDSLLAGRGSVRGQPRKQRAMSYGSRPRRKGEQRDGEQDPTTIPSSSYFGFLERLPFQIGKRSLRYRPSAADLQENPGGLRVRDHEIEPLIEEEDVERKHRSKGHQRQRSDTQASRSTNASLSSRGDLIMSDEEEDAVPLDDEFAVMLTRRTTNTGEDHSSGKTGSSNQRPGQSRRSTRTVSSKSHSSTGSRKSGSRQHIEPLSPRPLTEDDTGEVEPSSIVEFQKEEEQARQEEESQIEHKRNAARRLASRRGLSNPHKPDLIPTQPSTDKEHESEISSDTLHRPTLRSLSQEGEEAKELSSSVVTALRVRPNVSLPHALRDSAPPTPADEPFPEFRSQPMSCASSQLAMADFAQDQLDAAAEERLPERDDSVGADKPP